jgi:hypothetical protein
MEHGYDGLYERREKRPSRKRVSVATLEGVLQLYRENVEGALDNQEFNVLSSRSKTRVEKVLSSVR